MTGTSRRHPWTGGKVVWCEATQSGPPHTRGPRTHMPRPDEGTKTLTGATHYGQVQQCPGAIAGAHEMFGVLCLGSAGSLSGFFAGCSPGCPRSHMFLGAGLSVGSDGTMGSAGIPGSIGFSGTEACLSRLATTALFRGKSRDLACLLPGLLGCASAAVSEAMARHYRRPSVHQQQLQSALYAYVCKKEEPESQPLAANLPPNNNRGVCSPDGAEGR